MPFPGTAVPLPSIGRMPGIPGLRTWWAERAPAAGSAVMATGILSVGLHLIGAETVSRVALVLTVVAWVALAADFTVRLLGRPQRWVAEARSPGALTAVAATTVLGTRSSGLGGQTLAEALLALAALLWPVLLVLVVRHWGRRMRGAVFLCCVATQGLAVLAATLAAAEHTAWLAHTALVLFWLGLVLYGLALARFDARQVLEGPATTGSRAGRSRSRRWRGRNCSTPGTRARTCGPTTTAACCAP